MKKSIRGIMCVLLSIMLGIGIYHTNVNAKAKAKQLSVHFIDVGLGDGALVQFGTGKAAKYAVIDAGPVSYQKTDGTTVQTGKRVLNYLKKNKVKQLEFVLMTHAHNDHIGGFISIFDDSSIKIKKVYSPLSFDELKAASTSNYFGEHAVMHPRVLKSLLAVIEKKKIKLTVPKMKEKIYLGSCKVTFYPPLAAQNNKKMNLVAQEVNQSSIVCRLDYKKNSFLMTGDVQEKAVKKLVKAGANLKAQILKQPHHGNVDVDTTKIAKGTDYNSSHKYLINKAKPEVTVISNGVDNYQKVPRNKVLRDLAFCDTYITSKKGNIVITADGKKYSIKTQKGGIKPDYAIYKKVPKNVKVKSDVKGIKLLSTTSSNSKIVKFKKQINLEFSASFGRAGQKSIKYKIVPYGKKQSKYKWIYSHKLTYSKKKTVQVYVKFTNRVGKSITKKTNYFKMK